MSETAWIVLYSALAVCNFVVAELATIQTFVQALESWRKSQDTLLGLATLSWGIGVTLIGGLLLSSPPEKWVIVLVSLIGGVSFSCALWLHGWLRGLRRILPVFVWILVIWLGIVKWPHKVEVQANGMDDLEPAYRGKVEVQITGLDVSITDTRVDTKIRNIGRYRILPIPTIQVTAIISPWLMSSEEEEKNLFQNHLYWERICMIFNTSLEPGGEPVLCHSHPDPAFYPSDWDDLFNKRKVLYVLSRVKARDIKGSLPDADTCKFYVYPDFENAHLCWDHQN